MDIKSRRLSPARAAIAGLALAALPMASFAFVSVGVSITVAPPALPVYVQPPCPAVGYIWTPGYWAYGDDDYYWVPGTWVIAPSPGLLWTPGYWGWGNGFYVWHEGYWGPHVGFYGGVNYGYGYTGVGFEGGYWRGGAFYYNRSVSNLGGVHITNVYNKTVINNVNVTRVSYNGGEGGVRARPNSRELVAERDRHVAFTSMQRNQERAAFTNHDLRASVNQGRPRIAATQRPGVFTGHGVEAARAGEWHGGGDRGGAGRGPDARAGGDHGGAARGPDAHGAADRGGTGRGADVHAADRGPGRGADVHAADRGPGRGADMHAADRGGPGHGGPDRSGTEHVATRSDRPPGASGSAEVRGGTGGPAGGHGAENRGGSSAVGRGGLGAAGHEAGGSPAVHNDRPSMSRVPAGDGGNRSEPAAHLAGRNDRPPGAGGSAHFNQNNEMRNMSAGQRPGGSPQASPREFNGGGSSAPRAQMAPRAEAAPHPQMAPRAEAAPHPQMAPRTEAAPHPQMAPRMEAAPRAQMAPRPEAAPRPQMQMAPRQEAAPRPQSAPRPEMHRGGGEPHGQGGGGRPQGPQQARGGDHGRR